MRVVDFHVNVPGRGTACTLFGITDIHRGARGHREDLLKADVERIKNDPYAYWVCLGDVCDMILPGDKRFREQEVDRRYLDDLEGMPEACVKDLADILRPIADKCAGGLGGNHDIDHAKKHMYNPARSLCEALHVPYLGMRGIVRFSMQRPGGHQDQRQFMLWHGSGGGGTSGAVSNRLERELAHTDCDYVMVGHWHRKAKVEMHTVGALRRGRAAVTKRLRIGVACASYLDSYTDDHDDYNSDKGNADWRPGMSGIKMFCDDGAVVVE